MGQEHIFISHSSKNDDVVKRLREILELEKFELWVDSREFTGGDILEDTLQEKIKTAKSFIILFHSPRMTARTFSASDGPLR